MTAASSLFHSLSLAILAGCGASVGRTEPGEPWPELLGEHAGYEGDGGARVGERLEPFLLPDQYADEVDYRQFLGFVTAIEVGALWSVPCQEAAETRQALLEELQSDPVWLISILVQDQSGGPPDPADASAWAQRFGLELPVLADVVHEQQQAWEIAAWPTTLLVGPDGIVLERWDQGVAEQTLTEAVRAAVADHEGELRER